MTPLPEAAGEPRLWAALALCAVLAVLVGCARLVSPPRDDVQARALVESLVTVNSDLVQFKGLGNLRMEGKGQVLSGRMAWAAVSPDKLRVEWLNMLGQPVTSLAGDGRHISIVTLNDSKLHRTKQKKNALAGAIHVPVGIEELVALLAGRLPLPDYTAVWMDVDGADFQQIRLKDRWSNTVAAVQVDKPLGRPRLLTVYADGGEVLYRIEWTRWQQVEGRRLPRRIQMEAGGGEQLTLNLERYWQNTTLPPEAFVLTAPKR